MLFAQSYDFAHLTWPQAIVLIVIILGACFVLWKAFDVMG